MIMYSPPIGILVRYTLFFVSLSEKLPNLSMFVCQREVKKFTDVILSDFLQQGGLKVMVFNI